MIVIIYSVIAIIILFQLYIFLKTMGKIKSFKKAIPPVEGLTTVKVYLPQESDLNAEQILARKEKHMLTPDQRISEDSFYDHLVKSSTRS